MLSFDPEFSSGQTVYFKIGGAPGLVTGYHIRYPRKMQHLITYLVTWSEDREETEHYGFELTDTKPVDGCEQ